MANYNGIRQDLLVRGTVHEVNDSGFSMTLYVWASNHLGLFQGVVTIPINVSIDCINSTQNDTCKDPRSDCVANFTNNSPFLALNDGVASGAVQLDQQFWASTISIHVHLSGAQSGSNAVGYGVTGGKGAQGFNITWPRGPLSLDVNMGVGHWKCTCQCDRSQ